MKHTHACWQISLNATCPHCNQYIDLLDDPEFLSDNAIEVAEHDTGRSRNIETYCPECGELFLTELEY